VADKKKKVGVEALAASTEGRGAVEKLLLKAGGGKRAKVERGGTNMKQIQGAPVKVEVKKGEVAINEALALSTSMMLDLQKRLDEQNSSSSSSSACSSFVVSSAFPLPTSLSPVGAKDCNVCGSKNGILRATCWKCEVPF